MTIIRRPEILIGSMDDGQLMTKIQDKINEVMGVIAVLGERGKATGSITLKIEFTAEKNARLTIKPSLTAKVPEIPLAETPLFYTEHGELSTDHPSQLKFDLGVRQVETA